jgi:hypothetical protein
MVFADKLETPMMSFEEYFDRLAALHLQIETARRALQGFVQNQETLERSATDNLEEIRQMIDEGAKNDGSDAQSTWAYDQKAVAKYLEATKTHTIRTLADVGERLRQYDYILCIAVFESFLKDIHRAILLESPSLLKEDRLIPLGKLVSKGEKEVIFDEIEREVQMLDRESTKKKGEYFLERLGINWFEGAMIPILEGVIRLRNIMLHESPDRMVSESEYAMMLMAIVFIPTTTIAQAAILYPKVFKLPLKMKEEDARKMLFRAGAKSSDGKQVK